MEEEKRKVYSFSLKGSLMDMVNSEKWKVEKSASGFIEMLLEKYFDVPGDIIVVKKERKEKVLTEEPINGIEVKNSPKEQEKLKEVSRIIPKDTLKQGMVTKGSLVEPLEGTNAYYLKHPELL